MNLVRRLFFSTSPRISSSIRVERPPLPASGEREHLWPLLSLIAFIAFAATAPAFATEIPSSERRSDYELMGPQTRAIQDDDTANPGMLGAGFVGGALPGL